MNGSKVLMTTRFLDVAMSAGAQCSHLHFLSDEESLKFLLNEAFPHSNSSQNYGEDLGDMPVNLAKQCGGLPLALKVVGGLLAKKTPTFGVWDKVMRTFDWHSDGKECMNTLATSYEDLPNHVKSCFMSLACFPKNQEIQAKWLIRLWVAEGFLREKKMIIPEAGAEAEVESYLRELVNRCLIQVTKRYSNGRIKSCQIHDVFREAKERNFVCIHENDTLARDLKVARRVAFHYEVDKQTTFEENMLEEVLMPNVRSFYMSGVYVPIGRWLKFLKVLELSGTKDLKKLPTELTYMIFLRYLGLRSTGLTEIPKAIVNLSNLQTLDIRDTFIQSIHDSFWTIKTLRHVHVSDPLDQVKGPPPSANLENIQSLKMVRVRKAWRFGLPLLPLIRNLGLSCHRITDEPYSQPDLNLVTNLLASLENLVSLVIRGPSIPNELIPKTSPSYQNIKSLFLCGSERSSLNLDGFQIPPNLIKLTLQQFILNKDPMPILEKLGDLKTLCLKWLTVPPKMICSAGSFSQLERFEMVFLSGLEEWSIVEGAMPMLNKLLIGSCIKLNALPDFKNLNKLHEFTLSYPSQKLKEMIIQNPTYNAPNSFQWNKCGSAEFRLSAMS